MKNIFNDNNVYILGAGFSADASMPLVNEFLFKMREVPEWIQQTNQPLAKIRLKAIEDVFNFRLKASASAYRIDLNIENIEQLFSLASASESNKMSEAIIESIASTLDYCKHNYAVPRHELRLQNTDSIKIPFLTFKEAINEQIGLYFLDLYSFYSAAMLGLFKDGRVQGENTFISFNYDTLLEEGIWNNGLKIDYGLERAKYHDSQNFDTNGIKVLKLHGSVNWTVSNKRGQAIQVYRTYNDSLHSNVKKVIIPPTWRKTFTGSFEKIWSKAVQAISHATRIIIIGFSIPETDIHFKYLLAAALESNISLREIIFVNPMPKKEYDKKISRIFHSSFIDLGFIKHNQLKVSKYLMDGYLLKEIGREITIF